MALSSRHLPLFTRRTRREHIAAAVDVLVDNFVYYDRKEDKELPINAIQEAIAAGEVSVDEIGQLFTSLLEESVHRCQI